VVRHLGRSANSGHYITDVREALPGAAAAKGGGGKRVTWRRHDDSIVSHVRGGRASGRVCVCVCVCVIMVLR